MCRALRVPPGYLLVIRGVEGVGGGLGEKKVDFRYNSSKNSQQPKKESEC